jgi:endonuclease YncB( thermonuclease family)
MVYTRRWLFPSNISLEMVKAGYATVYDKSGKEYDGMEKKLIEAEQRARYTRHVCSLVHPNKVNTGIHIYRKKKLGMWSQSEAAYVSPAEHKAKFKQK